MSASFVDLTGLVILREETAVKLPLRWSSSSDDDVQANIESLQHEQEIYQRSGTYDGIVQCIGFSEISTQLALMSNGDLRGYLTQNRPSKPLQLLWFRQMARTLAHIHDRRIIVADIASRNLLLDSDLAIKFCDFTESTKMPLDTCMETANDGGYSTQTDIGQLGAVIYEVVAGERCEFDLFKDGRVAWPPRESLPSTQSVWLGPVIDKCWTEGAFRKARDLLVELESISIENDPIQPADVPHELGEPKKKNLLPAIYYVTVFKQYVSLRPITTLAATFSAIAVLTTWMWRRLS